MQHESYHKDDMSVSSVEDHINSSMYTTSQNIPNTNPRHSILRWARNLFLSLRPPTPPKATPTTISFPTAKTHRAALTSAGSHHILSPRHPARVQQHRHGTLHHRASYTSHPRRMAKWTIPLAATGVPPSRTGAYVYAVGCTQPGPYPLAGARSTIHRLQYPSIQPYARRTERPICATHPTISRFAARSV